jgi:hypothetical protein
MSVRAPELQCHSTSKALAEEKTQEIKQNTDPDVAPVIAEQAESVRVKVLVI